MAGKMDLRIWVEGTVVAAMAMALSFLPTEFASSGLNLSLGVTPLVLYPSRRGLLPGVATSFAWGTLDIILGTAMKDSLSVPQTIFEYPLAFTPGGTGGVSVRRTQLYFQTNRLRSAIHTIILGGIAAIFARWFRHFWVGVLVWGIYAPERMDPYLYSFVLNGASTVVNCLYVSLVLGLLIKVTPQLFAPKK